MTRKNELKLFLGMAAVCLAVVLALPQISHALPRHTIVNAGGVSVQHHRGFLGRQQTIVNTGGIGALNAGNTFIHSQHGLFGRRQTIVNSGIGGVQTIHAGPLGRQTIVNTGVTGVASTQYLFAPQPQRLLLNQVNTYTANPFVGSANLVVSPGYSYAAAPANLVTTTQYATAAPATIVETPPVVTSTPPATPQYQTAPTPAPPPAPVTPQYQTAPAAPPCPQTIVQQPQYVVQQPQFVVQQPQYVVQQPVVSYLINQPAFLATGTSYGCNQTLITRGRRQLIVNGY